jgi:hypothetical protein
MSSILHAVLSITFANALLSIMYMRGDYFTMSVNKNVAFETRAGRLFCFFWFFNR